MRLSTRNISISPSSSSSSSSPCMRQPDVELEEFRRLLKTFLRATARSV